MSRIRGLFDPSKPIDRRIEKVINYELVGEEQLKAEVTEYVATDSIEEHFFRLLDIMDQSMSGDAVVDTSAWVSGFYGSGKSSFTKYLGFALDPSKRIGERAFLDCLVDQFSKLSVKQKLKTVAAKHSLAVIMIDLASNQLAGAGMADVSSVLYWQVMQWAGYSRDRKIAYLEFMLERDGKREFFEKRYAALSGGKAWSDVQSNPLVAATWAAKLACECYPEIWKDPVEFSKVKLDEASFEEQRVKEMLDIVKRRSGTDKVVFIIDEVGQYIAGRDELILNLDGLAKNVKNFGRGKAWLVATAQQTLTEDSPQAQLNSPKLFKLKDRFPITIDLEASDIRTICHRRLLAKSSTARQELGLLFDQYGQKIIYATRLSQAKVITSTLDKESFIELYPFLPQHLDLLLILIGRLAKTSGGVGLRSAIKVVQDVLIDSGIPGVAPIADAEVGKLANAAIFYDCLKKDIQRSFPHVVQGVAKAIAAFGQDSMEGRLARAIGVLQSIEDFPLTAENAAALLLPSVDAEPLFDTVKKAAKVLLDEPLVPLAEVDGRLRFMSPIVDDLNKKRQSMQPATSELRDVYVLALRDLFSPKPSARTESGKNVVCGIKLADGTGWFPVQDDSEEIQVYLSLQKESQHQQELASVVERSRLPEYARSIFLVATEEAQLEHLAIEYWRSKKIYDYEHARALDKEVVSYLSGQQAKAQSYFSDLIARLRQSFLRGSFVFRGQPVGVSTHSGDLGSSLREELSRAGEDVYRKFKDASVQAEGGAAEGFLRTQVLSTISSKNDPLGFVDKANAKGSIKADSLAARDIIDYLDTRGLVEGKKLLDDFAQSPYGWFKDTTRYIVAVMLASGAVKLRVSGNELSTPTPQAIEALKGPQEFNKIGIMLRSDKPPMDLMLRTSERLLELTGKSVAPIERDIASAVLGTFPDFQNNYATLSAKLVGLGLAGADRAESLCDRISELLRGDASDAPYRIGQSDSELFRDLQWARDAHKALKEGAGALAERTKRLLSAIAELPPDGGVLEELTARTATLRDELSAEMVRDDWYLRRPEISQRLAAVEADVIVAFHAMTAECIQFAEKRWADIEDSKEFSIIGPEAREALALERPHADIPSSTGINDLEALYKQRYSLAMHFDKIAKKLSLLASGITEPERPTPAPGGEERREHRISIRRGIVRGMMDIDEAARGIEDAREAFDRGDTVYIE